MNIQPPTIQDNNLSRDYARYIFAHSSLSFSDVNRESLKILRSAINKRMIESGLIKGSFRMNPTRSDRLLTCKSFYFDKREAVSFNDDGFIGFAGWADSKNIVPIIYGFIDWVYEMDRK